MGNVRLDKSTQGNQWEREGEKEERQRENVCVWERENVCLREREKMYVCVRKRERKKDSGDFCDIHNIKMELFDKPAFPWQALYSSSHLSHP